MKRFLVFSLLVFTPMAASVAVDSTKDPVSTAEMISILDVAPKTYERMKRYPKFYGDPNMNRGTIEGSIWGRQYLLGSLWGARDTIADHASENQGLCNLPLTLR